MAQKRRKCDSDKYRKSQKRQRANHLAKAKLWTEIKRRENERIWAWRRDQELIAAREHWGKKESLTRLANLLSFHIWQLDPEYYNRWAAQRRLNSIWEIFRGGRLFR